MDTKITKFLTKLALQADFVGKTRHAACVTYKRQILGYGINQLKTHPIMAVFFPEHKMFLHAEIAAIIDTVNQVGNSFLSNCNLYVVRLGKDDKLKLSKPCSNCQEAIKFYKIKNVYHS